ncbi:MAG: N-succinylarginine dihydrolase [Gammaproteobacteria bacterium]
MPEVYLDGIVGPYHNYGGLSEGNIASLSHRNQPSSPKTAALQGIAKARLVHSLGLMQGFFIPHERPNFSILHSLGFEGNEKEALNKVSRRSPALLNNLYSSSAMWAANAGTFSPSVDCEDSMLHITPANLATMFHRSIETDFTYLQMELIFGEVAKVHAPLPNLSYKGDEGAANHLRISSTHDEPGFEIFVHGGSAFSRNTTVQRQALEASFAVATNHRLKLQKTFFIEQAPAAIAAGSFHNDIVSLANERVCIYHADAFAYPEEFKNIREQISSELPESVFLEISNKDISLEDLVGSYLLNSQLITKPISKEMCLILPEEVNNYPGIQQWLLNLPNNSPIAQLEFVDIKQSMMNGGGPACLRFKAQLQELELTKLNPKFMFNEKKFEALESLVHKYYRDRLLPKDLQDYSLLLETREFLNALTELLDLGSIYNFQK